MRLKNAFSLTDVLLTMIVIGIIFTLTIPVLSKRTDDKELIANLKNFSTKLEDAITKWKTSMGCPYKAGECFKFTQKTASEPYNFNLIKPYLNIVDEINSGPSDKFWLPLKTTNYYGNGQSEFDFRSSTNRHIYLMVDGTIFSVAPDTSGFWILVDVNGKKPPNRIGKDTFHMTIGYEGNDINYNALHKTSDGICGHGMKNKIKCDPDNTNPTIGEGASPTAYVLLNFKLPDFKALSETLQNFKP